MVAWIRASEPPLTPLLGREHEIAAVRQLLLREDVRLVTLTGGPGVGKTRLATQIAEQLDHEFGRVVWVPLETVRDSGLVTSAIARALGLEPGHPDLDRRVVEALAHEPCLLAVDNFEQVLTAATLVATLLAECQPVTALVTSRVRLNLRGEHEFLVTPFGLPGAADLEEPEAVRSAPAVNLFIERARAATPDFELTAQSARAVAQICIRLDGVPLGIELAAARLRMLSAEAIPGRLDESLDVLAHGPLDLPPRQQSWRRALDWSHDLLDADAQLLLRRVAVCMGGWGIDSARAMLADAAGPDEALDLITDAGGQQPRPAARGRIGRTSVSDARHGAAVRDGEAARSCRAR